MRFKKIILPFVALLAVCVVPLAYGPVALAQEAGPGQGLVVFSRKSSMKGKAIRFNLEQDGRPIGQLLSGTTLEFPLPPGNYTFSVSAPSLDGQDVINISVEAGKTYHVTGKILWGWPAGRPKFGGVTESGVATSPAVEAPDASALAGAALGSVTAQPSAGAQNGRTAEESGRIGLRNFVGEWDLEMWSLAADGSKLEGHGVVEGTAEGESATRITFTEFAAPAFPAATGGGQVRIAYEDGKGFTLESWFKYSGEVLNFSGRYEADTGRYIFFAFGSDGEIATGVASASVRVEIRSVDIATWVAETYSSVDGQSLLVQSYRFSRR